MNLKETKSRLLYQDQIIDQLLVQSSMSKNNTDSEGITTSNKTRLVSKGYTHQ